MDREAMMREHAGDGATQVHKGPLFKIRRGDLVVQR